MREARAYRSQGSPKTLATIAAGDSLDDPRRRVCVSCVGYPSAGKWAFSLLVPGKTLDGTLTDEPRRSNGRLRRNELFGDTETERMGYHRLRFGRHVVAPRR